MESCHLSKQTGHTSAELEACERSSSLTMLTSRSFAIAVRTRSSLLVATPRKALMTSKLCLEPEAYFWNLSSAIYFDTVVRNSWNCAARLRTSACVLKVRKRGVFLGYVMSM